MSSVLNTLNTASQYLGTQDWNNYCEAFVEQSLLGHTGVYPSAASAWESQQQSGAVQGLKGIQPGDSVYFAPDKSNNNYGHTGIYAGNGQFISATYNGVKQVDINQWMQSTGQKVLGYVPSGQEGRGAVKAATVHGGILNNQMALAGSTPDDPQAQAKLQQQFALQQQQAAQQQKQALAQQQFNQAASYTPSVGSQNKQTPQATSQIAQQPIPQQLQMPQPGQNQPTQYPFASQLTPANGSPTQPQTAQQPAFQSKVVVSQPTDLSKPQQNLNPYAPQAAQGGQ